MKRACFQKNTNLHVNNWMRVPSDLNPDLSGRMKKSYPFMIGMAVSLLITVSMIGCNPAPKKGYGQEVSYYSEQYRPQFHFTPEANWMNDPNGMVYYEGEYHLFYQYYPDSTVWGPMHWGHAISEVLVHLDENNNATYEICELVAWDNLVLTDSLISQAKASGLIIYGTLASRNPETRKTILRLLENDVVKLIDVNLRQPYDTREIVEQLILKSDIVKLNDEELGVFGQWYNKHKHDEESLVKWFAEEFNSKMVIVTKGDKGALLYSDGVFYEHQGFKVDAVDTVGAGDAFLAGFIAALLDGKTNDKALEFACATGAFVASKAGATPEYDRIEIEQLLISK